MLITVMYRDGTCGLVRDFVLDKLIHSEKILQFCRSGRWVVIGRDPVRGMGGSGAGYRRRKYDKLHEVVIHHELSLAMKIRGQAAGSAPLLSKR